MSVVKASRLILTPVPGGMRVAIEPVDGGEVLHVEAPSDPDQKLWHAEKLMISARTDKELLR